MVAFHVSTYCDDLQHHPTNIHRSLSKHLLTSSSSKTGCPQSLEISETAIFQNTIKVSDHKKSGFVWVHVMLVSDMRQMITDRSRSVFIQTKLYSEKCFFPLLCEIKDSLLKLGIWYTESSAQNFISAANFYMSVFCFFLLKESLKRRTTFSVSIQVSRSC